MISLRLLTRNVTPQLAATTQCLHTSKILLNADSSDSSDSDDEKRTKNAKQPEQAQTKADENSVHRLNSLLQTMTTKAKLRSKVDVAVNPKKLVQQKPKLSPRDPTLTGKLFEHKLAGAAKEVAASLGGDVNKTESELLKKILAPTNEDQQPINLSELVKGMNIDRTKPTDSVTSSSRADQVRIAMQRTRQYTPQQQKFDQPKMRERYKVPKMSSTARVNLDSGTLINIFDVETASVCDPDTPTLNTWDLLEEREHQLLVTHPPINFLEQMIRWTEQGRLWRFPIDNEQDMHIGQEEHFSEHVFLEQHLEGWCPSKGPIRHFMELVCVGLSKNPYMFAKDKRERIMWFKNYFAEKHDLLKELGAYGTEATLNSDGDKKQIEA